MSFELQEHAGQLDQHTRLARRVSVLTAVAVTALVLGPLAGFVTARNLDHPGPVGPQGPVGQPGPRGLRGPDGETVTPNQIRSLMADQLATIEQELSDMRSSTVDTCLFTIAAVTDVRIIDNGLGQPLLVTDKARACSG